MLGRIDLPPFGHVVLIDKMGDDQRVVDAARKSYDSSSKGKKQDKKLSRFLMKERHTSPFEQVKFTFVIKCPIFVARQIVRHRMSNMNELSARYTEMPEHFHTIPFDGWRLQSKTNKQGSNGLLDFELGKEFSRKEEEFYKQAYSLYKEMLEAGISRELARKVLPTSLYTEFYLCMDLHNFFHFSKLRTHDGAQEETRDVANAAIELVKDHIPVAYKAFMDYHINSKTFSVFEMESIKDFIKIATSDGNIKKLMLNQIKNNPDEDFSQRERDDFINWLESLTVENL